MLESIVTRCGLTRLCSPRNMSSILYPQPSHPRLTFQGGTVFTGFMQFFLYNFYGLVDFFLSIFAHFCPFLSSRRKEGTLSAVKQQCRPCRGDLVRILRVATTSEHLQHVPSSLTEASFCSAHPPPSLV